MLYKTNLFGISEVGQPQDSSNVRIPLPLVSDNGQFELTLVPIDNKGILKITNKVSNQLYWNSKDYNTLVFNNPAAYGLSGNIGTNIELVLQNNGDLVIRTKIEDVKAFSNPCFSLSQNSTFSSHMIWSEGDRTGPFKIKLTDEGILELKNKNDVVIWKTTYMWESMDTPFSIDILDKDESTTKTPISFLSKMLYKNDGVSGPLDDSIIKQYYDKKFKNTNLPVDFSPFKIVPFEFLKYIGKTSYHVGGDGNILRNTMIVDKGGDGYEAILDMSRSMNFQGNENYLPLGDPFFRRTRGDNISLDLVLMELQQMFFSFVLLVKNEDKYCNKETKSKYKWVSDNYKCKFGNPNFFNLWYPTDMSYFLPNNIKTGSNYAIGAVTGRETAGGNNSSIIRPGTPSGDIFIAASVNAKYLIEYENINPKSSDSEWFLGEYYTQTDDNGNYCENDFGFWCTSPWGTWALASNASGWYSENTFNKFFDFIPEAAALDMALGNFIPTIAGEKITLSKENIYGIATDLCINNKQLNSKSCIDFYRSLRNSPETFDYSRLITDYCASNDLYKTDAYKRICACHYPTEVYEKYIKDILEGIPEAQRKQVEASLTQPAPCIYPACSLESIEVIPRWNFSRGENCNDDTYQICINKTDVVNEGTIGGNVVTQSMIDCLQQNIKTTPTDTPTTVPPGTKKSSNNTLWIILGVVFVVLIILYFTVFKK